MPEIAEPHRFEWILYCPAGDPNYASALSQLTDEELAYYAGHERRKSGLQQIAREMRRRARERHG